MTIIAKQKVCDGCKFEKQHVISMYIIIRLCFCRSLHKNGRIGPDLQTIFYFFCATIAPSFTKICRKHVFTSLVFFVHMCFNESDMGQLCASLYFSL